MRFVRNQVKIYGPGPALHRERAFTSDPRVPDLPDGSRA